MRASRAQALKRSSSAVAGKCLTREGQLGRLLLRRAEEEGSVTSLLPALLIVLVRAVMRTGSETGNTSGIECGHRTCVRIGCPLIKTSSTISRLLPSPSLHDWPWSPAAFLDTSVLSSHRASILTGPPTPPRTHAPQLPPKSETVAVCLYSFYHVTL
jgi:hypothetical protein